MLRILIHLVPVVLLCYLLFVLMQYLRSASIPTSRILSDELHPPDPLEPLPPSSSILHVFENAAVCSDSKSCSAIGRDILQIGGSAVDSALATLLCNGLVAMQSMGLGGGLLMNVYIRAEQRSYSILARERAPALAKDDMLRNASDKISPHSIAVPAEIMGYAEAHKRFGRLPWSVLVRPTIEICLSGFRLSKHQRDALETNRVMVLQDKHLRDVFVDSDTGNFYVVGSRIQPPRELCETYKNMAENGPEDFYRGHLAAQLAADFRDAGSLITKKDLQSMKAIVMPAEQVALGDHILHIVPPPGSGHIIALVMKILENFKGDFEKSQEFGTEDAHRIVEALKFAFVQRWQLDTNGDQHFIAQLISPQFSDYIANLINDNHTYDDPQYYGADLKLMSPRIEHGTAHISVLAPNGDAVSATSSINYYFGSGKTGSRTAILFNNAVSDFSIRGLSNYFGLPYISNRNVLLPGSSPMSSMSPVIITDQHGQVRLTAGAAGGTKIISAMVLLLVRVLWMQLNIKQAIDAARFHHQLLPNVLEYEFGCTEDLISALKVKGHSTLRYRERGSAICGIERTASDLIYANADHRKDGGVVGY